MIKTSEQRKATFYAAFASIQSLRDLSPRGRIRLAQQFEAASSMHIRDGFGGVTQRDFHYNLEFSALHGFVRSTLERLLAGEHVAVRAGELPPPVWHLDRKRGGRSVAQTWNVTEPKRKPATEFVGLLFQRPFPFDRCPICQTFFVHAGRRRYCSRECATRGVEAARKSEKREYMRKYMRKRRAKERRNRQ